MMIENSAQKSVNSTSQEYKNKLRRALYWAPKDLEKAGGAKETEKKVPIYTKSPVFRRVGGETCHNSDEDNEGGGVLGNVHNTSKQYQSSRSFELTSGYEAETPRTVPKVDTTSHSVQSYMNVSPNDTDLSSVEDRAHKRVDSEEYEVVEAVREEKRFESENYLNSGNHALGFDEITVLSEPQPKVKPKTKVLKSKRVQCEIQPDPHIYVDKWNSSKKMNYRPQSVHLHPQMVTKPLSSPLPTAGRPGPKIVHTGSSPYKITTGYTPHTTSHTHANTHTVPQAAVMPLSRHTGGFWKGRPKTSITPLAPSRQLIPVVSSSPKASVSTRTLYTKPTPSSSHLHPIMASRHVPRSQTPPMVLGRPAVPTKTVSSNHSKSRDRANYAQRHELCYTDCSDIYSVVDELDSYYDHNEMESIFMGTRTEETVIRPRRGLC